MQDMEAIVYLVLEVIPFAKTPPQTLCLDVQPSYRVNFRTSEETNTYLCNKCHGEAYDDEWDAAAAEPGVAVAQGAEEEGRDIREGLMRYLHVRLLLGPVQLLLGPVQLLLGQICTVHLPQDSEVLLSSFPLAWMTKR
ncbi:hypothetical protein NQZ68_016783 [Dissostichus eleginoides]|nr:hypothetical protein NQZ68_016783 [Dissostichus eleginoides]